MIIYAQQSLVDFMVVKGWIWKPAVAGLAGTSVHALFMYFKARSGLLPSFQPYHSFQVALSHWLGENVPRSSLGRFRF